MRIAQLLPVIAVPGPYLDSDTQEYEYTKEKLWSEVAKSQCMAAWMDTANLLGDRHRG